MIIGAFLVLASFINSSTYVESQDVAFLKLTLTTDIKIIKGRNSDNAYRFWAEEYATQFVIQNGINPFKDDVRESLTKGTNVEVLVPKNYDITDKLEETPVYALFRNGKDYLTLKQYNISSSE